MGNATVPLNVATAITMAQADAGALAPNPSGVSAQLVSFTDTVHGVVQADGSVHLSWVDKPAWIIRFTGVPQPVLGGPTASGVEPGPAAQELSVVLDAYTGEYLEMFSFQ